MDVTDPNPAPSQHTLSSIVDGGWFILVSNGKHGQIINRGSGSGTVFMAEDQSTLAMPLTTLAEGRPAPTLVFPTV